MINIGSSVFEANALFLQPTWSCGKACHGCYVKEKESKFGSYEMHEHDWSRVIEDVVALQSKIRTKQVTLALDALSSKDIKQMFKMMDIADEYFKELPFKNTECHMTVNHLGDLTGFMGYLDNYSDGTYDVIDGLDLLSISNIRHAEEVDKAKLRVPGAKINWNVTSGDFVKQITRHRNEVMNIIRKVDSVYLLLHKAPMGLDGHDLNGFFEALEYLKDFNKVKAESTDGEACAVPGLISKFNLDGCMNDSRQFNVTGNGCSANLSRFQIWPDGRVTGCAYNSHNQYGVEAKSFEDVIDNLKDAKDRYEFKTCTIPKALTDHSNKHRSLKVVTA